MSLQITKNDSQNFVFDTFLKEKAEDSIKRLYQNKVSVAYVAELNNKDLPDNFDSTSISKLFQIQIPVGFIENLNNRGLLENMSYTSVISAYKIDGE